TVFSAGSGEIQKVAAIGKKVGPSMRSVLPCSIKFGERRGRPAGCGNLVKRCYEIRCEDYGALTAPRSSARIACYIAESLGTTAGNINLLEFVLGEKTYEPAVR